MDKNIEYHTKKRTHSDLSDRSLTSPVTLPFKIVKISGQSDSETMTDILKNQHKVDLEDPVSETLTTDQKIDQILHLLKSHIVKSEVDITTLQHENRSLKLRLMETEGTVVKLSAKVKNLEDKVDSLSIRSMKGNLVFYNISETDGEDCREVVDNFIRNVLKVPNLSIISTSFPLIMSLEKFVLMLPTVLNIPKVTEADQ